tara:strand:+ start:272 stop:703 length:432 start_codon:yes stop_codon:yes gene_type:complete
MIKYKLICKECFKTFDSWFSTSKEFDKLKILKLVNCSFCGSLNVNKSLMAPNILNKNNKDFHIQEKKIKTLKNKIKHYQKFIKNNLKYVGENFAFEARSIHYNSKKKKFNKGIYGKATNEEIKDLKQEGIETQTIPWIEDKEN